VTVARLFVAVQPPDDVLERLEELDRPVEPGVRYTTRDQWHVTLRFLGETEVAAAVDALDDLDAAPTTAVLGPQVSKLGRAVVVVPVAGLDGLARRVREATAAIGEPVDPRPFAGHLTIARLRRRGACRIAGAPVSAQFPVDEVHLVRSVLDPGGARHERISSRRLEASG
jgi:2'-5' RNA ligase